MLLPLFGIIPVIQRVRNCTLSLTQRSSGFVLELAFLVSFLDGIEQCWHVLSETPKPIGATALHGLQVPSVGLDGPLENFLLSPKDTEVGILLCFWITVLEMLRSGLDSHLSHL